MAVKMVCLRQCDDQRLERRASGSRVEASSSDRVWQRNYQTWSQSDPVARKDEAARSIDFDFGQSETDGLKQSQLRHIAANFGARISHTRPDGQACTARASMNRKPCYRPTSQSVARWRTRKVSDRKGSGSSSIPAATTAALVLV
ncbi:hypothetical protein PHSY_002542 [Pseudozyma hubeiensis SY62]|uniref:Uncharacterized protein n=1 Tax=Pseudozyma hubeiensis (strain SY62) TaxID=1305764 RepID=R9P1C7_PSEHS|nr:hypothetical protein PHSY_002542 [Pseudozyma hubeiensis SY62]GAC94969.1 hypothetical protein PHSY_002542 [Pseudozyma hubeiensis SY62]